jgi:hypothetical protein
MVGAEAPGPADYRAIPAATYLHMGTPFAVEAGESHSTMRPAR